MEPEEFYFEPFIKPLLDTPGSTYHHIKLKPYGAKTQWFAFRNVYARQLQESIKSTPTSNDVVPGKLNPNILVIGNASRLCKFGGVKEFRNPFGVGLLRDLSVDALSHQLFNLEGPVRMLWWLPERYRHTVIPPHYVYDRSKVSATIEMAYNVSEVAGVQAGAASKEAARVGYTERSRPELYDEVSRQTVAGRMENAGVVPPKGRKLLGSRPSTSEVNSGVRYLSPLSNTAETVDGFKNQMTVFKERLDQLSVWIGYGTATGLHSVALAKARADARAGALATMTYPQCATFYQHSNAAYADTVAIISDMAFRLVNMEAGFAKLKEEHEINSTKDDVYNQIKALRQEFQDVVVRSSAMAVVINKIVEEELAFCSSSPLSMLDGRAYEPLKAETADFYPEQNMTLLDFMPRGIDLSVPGLATRQECTTLTTNLLKNIFLRKTKPVPLTLDTTVGVNAGTDLVKMVPEITDIRKGGRMDPNDLRVRALTREMIEGLAKAFFEWPFQPENWQVTLARSKEEAEEESKVAKKRKEDVVLVEEEEDEEEEE